jgi:hypothetical protein
MRVIKHSPKRIPADYLNQAINLIDENEDEFRDKYVLEEQKEYRRLKSRLQLDLAPILWLTHGNLDDRRILDLGCGSILTTDGTGMYRTFEPWLCRLLAMLGARPIGIDIFDQFNEPFESYRYDIVSSIFPDIDDKVIDITRSSHTLDSRIMDMLHPDFNPERYLATLPKRLDRIVKDDGFYILGYYP